MATVRVALADLARAPLPTRSLTGGSDVVVVSVRPMRLRPGAPRVRLPFDRRVQGRLGWYGLVVRLQLLVSTLALLLGGADFLLKFQGHPAADLQPLLGLAVLPSVIMIVAFLAVVRVQPYPQVSWRGVVVIQGMDDSVAAEWRELAGDVVSVGA